MQCQGVLHLCTEIPNLEHIPPTTLGFSRITQSKPLRSSNEAEYNESDAFLLPYQLTANISKRQSNTEPATQRIHSHSLETLLHQRSGFREASLQDDWMGLFQLLALELQSRHILATVEVVARRNDQDELKHNLVKANSHVDKRHYE